MSKSTTNTSKRRKRALVTGATGSLGSYLTRSLLNDGWSVYAICRDVRKMKVSNPNLRSKEIDFRKPEAPSELHELLIDSAPDLVIHAAVSYGPSHNEALSLEEIENIFRVNAFCFFSAFTNYTNVNKLKSSCCCIIINSDGIFHTTPETSVYASSKAALRVLTSGLALSCKSSKFSISTLLLGPLADKRKTQQLQDIANNRNLDLDSLIAKYLSQSNPFLAIDEFIDLESCYKSIIYMHDLGKISNGMICRLDGGSAGSLL